MKVKKLWKCFHDAGYYTVMHDGIEHAGYLAFLGLLSFFPFLVFFVALAGFIGSLEVSELFIREVIVGYIPADIIPALKPRIDEIVSGPPQGLLTIAIIGVIWTASSAVEGIRTILNRAYRVTTPPSYLFRRLMSIAQFLMLTIAIIVAMFILILGPVIWRELTDFLHVDNHLLKSQWSYISYAGSSAILFLVVAISYYILPNIKQTWLAVAPGTFIVMLGWLLSAELFSVYLENFEQVNLVYGSIGGIIVALLFFYIIAVIYIFGAEFNYFFEKAIGYQFEQKEDVLEEISKPENRDSIE